MEQNLKITRDMITDGHRLIMVLFALTLLIGGGAVICEYLLLDQEMWLQWALITVVGLLVYYLLFVLLFYPSPYRFGKKLKKYHLVNAATSLNQTYFANSLCYGDSIVLLRKRIVDFYVLDEVQACLVAKMKGRGFRRRPWYRLEIVMEATNYVFKIHTPFQMEHLALFLDGILTDFPTMQIGYNWLNNEKYQRIRNQFMN